MSLLEIMILTTGDHCRVEKLVHLLGGILRIFHLETPTKNRGETHVVVKVATVRANSLDCTV